MHPGLGDRIIQTGLAREFTLRDIPMARDRREGPCVKLHPCPPARACAVRCVSATARKRVIDA